MADAVRNLISLRTLDQVTSESWQRLNVLPDFQDTGSAFVSSPKCRLLAIPSIYYMEWMHMDVDFYVNG